MGDELAYHRTLALLPDSRDGVHKPWGTRLDGYYDVPRIRETFEAAGLIRAYQLSTSALLAGNRAC